MSVIGACSAWPPPNAGLVFQRHQQYNASTRLRLSTATPSLFVPQRHGATQRHAERAPASDTKSREILDKFRLYWLWLWHWLRLLKRICLACLALSLLGCGYGPDGRVAVAEGEPFVDSFEEFNEVDLPPPADTPPPGLVLDSRDVVEVEVFGEKFSRELCQVGVDGRLYYGPLPGIDVRGMTIPELQERLTKELAQWYRHPRVLINIDKIESQTVTMLGRVNKPGMIRLSGGERLADVIAMTGGLATSRFSGSTEELADLSGAMYLRQGEFIPVNFNALIKRGDTKYNIRVHSGDYCYIPSRLSREVYVLGAVGTPKSIGYSENLTVVTAIAKAGGMSGDAYMNRVLLIRGSTSQPQAARIRVDDILQGHRKDVVLKPRDIVYVPGRTADNPYKYFETASTSFAVGATAVFAEKVYSTARGGD